MSMSANGREQSTCRMVFNQVFIQMYFTPEDFFNVFIRLLSQVLIRDAPGISEKDENRSKSTKVTKVNQVVDVRA